MSQRTSRIRLEDEESPAEAGRLDDDEQDGWRLRWSCRVAADRRTVDDLIGSRRASALRSSMRARLRRPESVRGAHADQVVHEHRGGARTLAGGDDELLRTRGGGIPRRVQPGTRSRPDRSTTRWPSSSRSTSSPARNSSAGSPLRPHEPAVDRDPRAVGQAHGRHRAAIAFEVVDAAPLDDDSGCRELRLFDGVDDVRTIGEDGEPLGPAGDQPRAGGEVGVSPIRASGRSCSSHASHAAQLNTLMP